MNKQFIRTSVVLISTVALFLSGCNRKSEDSKTTNASTVTHSEEAQALIIDIPEPRTDGTLTITDANGNVYFQYCGEINIKNSGRNGNPINIEVTMPSESIESDDTTYSNTLPVVLYDKDGMSIQQYLTHPVFRYGVLELRDVEQTY